MTTSISIDISELEKLKDYILKTGMKRAQPKNEYELLRIEDGDINIIVYKSGKLVHNDTEASQNVIQAILSREKEYDFIIGSDEVGKGEWYGPLVVVSVALMPNEMDRIRKMGVRDSKSMAKKKLKEIAKKLMQLHLMKKSLILMPEKYNELYQMFKNENKTLNDLLAWAHARSIKDLIEWIKSEKIRFETGKIVIDKFDVKKTDLRLSTLDKTNLEIIQKSRGESEIPVAVASIIAKSIFENKVDELNKKFKIDLRNSSPADIDPKVLPFVAKTHFKNVKQYLPNTSH